MKRGQKTLLGVLGTVVVIVGVALYLVWSNLDSLVAGAIVRYGSEATGTHVSVGKVHVSLSAGTAQINDLTIDNPRGYQTPFALRFRSINVGLSIPSLRSDTIVMNDVDVDGSTVNGEFKGKESNLQEILDNLKRFAPSKPAKQPSGEEKRFMLKQFNLKNASATLAVDAANVKRSISVPDVSLHDIGTQSGGVDAAELARQILRPIIDKALQQARDAVQGKALESLKKKAREKLEEKLKKVGKPPAG